MKDRPGLLAIVLLPLVLTPIAAKEPKRSIDLLVRGGAVVTMDPGRRIIEDGAVAISGDRIAEVGDASDLDSRYTARKVVNARGKIVLPGLINLHTHSSMIFFRGLVDDDSLDTWGRALRPLHDNNDDRPGFKRWADAVACLEMLMRGTTTFVEMYHNPELVADVAKGAGLRTVVTLRLPFEQGSGRFIPQQAEREFEKFYRAWRSDRLVTPGLAVHAPHTVPTEVVRFTKQLADRYDVPLVIHLAEGQSEIDQIKEKFGKTPTEYLESLGFLSDRVLAVHAIRLSDGDIAILKRRGVSVAHNPESNAKMGNGVARIPDLLGAGIHVGLGTDSGVTNNNLDLFEEMNMAVKLQRALHGNPAILTAQQALEMATIGGAAAIHMEKEIGSLEAGKKADLIIVDIDRPELQPVYNYYSHLVYVAQGGDVDTNMVNGRVLMEQRRVLTMDVSEIKRKAGEYRKRVLEGMKGQ